MDIVNIYQYMLLYHYIFMNTKNLNVKLIILNSEDTDFIHIYIITYEVYR